ncbi:hypothetical protein [Thermoanaerobacterium sp. DL9XJH110]|uniref:hypothetical protein n=1 Tax=Thermoanaerobacterium sp. DL9XJH110 TaxID=3386643 RepID=UPI003BB65F08
MSGGNGKELQEICCDVTPEILELAKVDKYGNIENLDIGVKISVYEDKEYSLNEVLVDYTLVEGQSFRGFYCNIEGVREVKRFSEPQTVEQLIEWEKNRVKKITEKKAILEEQKKLLEKEYKKKEKIINEQEQELEKKKKEKEEKIRQKKEQIIKERKAWIEQHGSEKLKLALELGYECQTDYVYERARKEFPDFTLDYFDNGCWDEADNPSFETLKAVKELIDKGYNAYIVKIKKFPYDEDNDSENDYNDYYDNIEGEAIVISNYLGKYDLVKLVS